MNTRCEAYRRLYNEIRPHEEIDFYPPTRRYLDAVPISFEEERRFHDRLDEEVDLDGDRPDQ